MKSLDTDSSGGVSLDEFKTVGKSLPSGKFDQSDDALSKAYSSLDADGDGSLTQGEIAQGLAKFSNESASALLDQQEFDGPPPPPGGDGESFFDKADADGSGGVSLDEFEAAGPKDADPTKAEELFASIDADGDGEISKSEDDAFRASNGGGHGGPHGAGGPPPGPPPSGGASASDDDDDDDSSATNDLLAQLSDLLSAKQAYGQSSFALSGVDDAITSLFSSNA